MNKILILYIKYMPALKKINFEILISCAMYM